MKITIETFIDENRALINKLIKDNHIRTDVICGGYDREDIYSEIYLAICEVFTDGALEYPLQIDDAYELFHTVTNRLERLKTLEVAATLPTGYVGRDGGDKRLSEETKTLVRNAQKPYIPLDISSGTSVRAIEMENKVSTKESRQEHSPYAFGDFSEDFSIAEVLYETFAEEEHEAETNLYSFLETLSQLEREVVKRLMDGESGAAIERELGLSEKWVQRFRKRAKRFLAS